MTSALDVVKQAYKAWEAKDKQALRNLLHTNYKGKIPGGMEIIGIEGAEQCLEQCPSECHSENEMYITEGNKVVRIWDMVTTAPKPYRIRMAELNIVEDGKVILNEAFFDTAAFPEEVQKEFQEFLKKQPVGVSGKSS
ncbi:MAG TPA: nuclear transport factor 2 family protein [Candidatus Obscuribacterales bacterium]